MTRTPGPYIIGQPGGPSGPFYSLINQQGWVVAMQIPNEADAVALSANPDLLAACESVMLLLGPSTSFMGQTEITVKLVEAALAKAKGESA